MCLKKWCELKLSTRETNNKPGVTYVIKSFNCELCKEPYQSKFIFILYLYFKFIFYNKII